MSRRVDHHIIIFSTFFLFTSSFDWGIKSRFGLFCVSRLAQTHTHTYYYLLLLLPQRAYRTIYHPRGAFDIYNRSHSSRQPLIYLFWISIRFFASFSSILEYFEHTHLMAHRNTPYRPKKEGRALALALLEAKYTSHSTPTFFSPLSTNFCFLYTKKLKRRNKKEAEEGDREIGMESRRFFFLVVVGYLRSFFR
ncbi:hypothetical protein J3E69DRAFT_313172 [Trichoderma sp. SZMC 28015]